LGRLKLERANVDRAELAIECASALVGRQAGRDQGIGTGVDERAGTRRSHGLRRPAVVAKRAELQNGTERQVIPTPPGEREPGVATGSAEVDVYRAGAHYVRPVGICVSRDHAVLDCDRPGPARPGDPATALAGGRIGRGVTADRTVLDQERAGERSEL